MTETAARVGWAAPRALAALWLLATYGQLWLFGDAHAVRHQRALLLVFLFVGTLALAVPKVGATFGRLVLAAPRWAFVGFVAALATFASYVLQRGVQNGQVVALDSCVYLLQARALSHFSFGVPLPEPHLGFGGRFLFEGPDGRLFGVFPPGFPLFLVPFVWLGKPMLAAPALAFAMTCAQWLLARRVTGDELAARGSLLLTLPSFARALQTSDLLSHAFVATLACLALALVLRPTTRPATWPAAVAGLLVGWAFSARLLDGLVLFVVALAPLVFAWWRGRAPLRLALVFALSTAPFVGLLAASQRAATGSYATPTQSEYFRKSDWPPTCHRLGFGRDVGCAVEHPAEKGRFGPDGYGLDDAHRVVRERAEIFGIDLFGFGLLAWFGVSLPLRRRSPKYAYALGLVVAMTFAYGLFYYGNAPGFGARHLFSVAPVLWILTARGLVAWRARDPALRERVRGGLLLAALGVGAIGQVERWRKNLYELDGYQALRGDMRARATASGVEAGIIATADEYHYLATFDPVADGPKRLFVYEDYSGFVELRRAHPGLGVYDFRGPSVVPRELPPVPPGLRLELELAWPSFVEPRRLATRKVDTMRTVKLPASGQSALVIFVSEPGAELSLPFWVTEPGALRLTMKGITVQNGGEYELAIDGRPFGTWHGYSLRPGLAETEPSAPVELTKGRHVFSARCVGKSEHSRGYLAGFDVLVGEPPVAAPVVPSAP
ncbi:MAG: hypothetical protein IT374_04240 [Polyangiaceae bacterium]|nr:hypothetical protein [Polyangiaceae bacterium]